MAQAGDFQAILAKIPHIPRGTLDLHLVEGYLQSAVEQASRLDPAQFTSQTFRAMTAFTTNLTMRLQINLQLALNDHHGRGIGAEDAAGQLLPQLQTMQKLTAELHQSWASSTRMWDLAERKRADKKPCNGVNGKARKPDPFEALYEGRPLH